jgi:hypothetical protein
MAKCRRGIGDSGRRIDKIRALIAESKFQFVARPEYRRYDKRGGTRPAGVAD